MKRIAIFTSALLLLCGMTGCGKSSGGTAVYTDVDIHDENIVRHCIEQPADDPQPDSWLYTEIVSDDPGRLRYITSTETVGDSEAGTDAARETVAQPVEIDVFEGAEINVDEVFGLRYPQSIMATFKSEFKVTTEISLVEATPTHIVFRVTANENSSILKENNYVLRDTEKLYEVDVTTISHYLLSSDEITEELEEEIINGMLEEEEFSNRSDVELIALYTILPPDDFNYISEEKSFTASYAFQEGTVSSLYHGVYGVFKDSQNHYYAASAVPKFDEDGVVSIKYEVLTGDVNKYEALGKYEFDNFDDAFECIEKIHQRLLDTTVLTEFKTYTDTTSEQQETAESTDAE